MHSYLKELLFRCSLNFNFSENNNILSFSITFILKSERFHDSLLKEQLKSDQKYETSIPI